MDEVEAKDLTILGASFDSVEENRAFAEKFDFPYSLLCDTDKSLAIAYGAAGDTSAGYPNRISYVIGEDGAVLLAYAKVKPKKHLDQILGDL
jgi:peroxiredoxin Q/BCP